MATLSTFKLAASTEMIQAVWYDRMGLPEEVLYLGEPQFPFLVLVKFMFECKLLMLIIQILSQWIFYFSGGFQCFSPILYPLRTTA